MQSSTITRTDACTPATRSDATAMMAQAYQWAGRRACEDGARPTIMEPTDAIVRITMTTICGTDLHILKGNIPTVANERILGHEGVGVIEELGTNVCGFHKGDRVLISCIIFCGRCAFCRKAMHSHCRMGGWLLGNQIDGTQAQHVRIPYADTSLHALPRDVNEESATLVSDILPTGLKSAVLNCSPKTNHSRRSGVRRPLLSTRNSQTLKVTK